MKGRGKVSVKEWEMCSGGSCIIDFIVVFKYFRKELKITKSLTINILQINCYVRYLLLTFLYKY